MANAGWQKIEGNPLTIEEIAMFEILEREGWSSELRRAHWRVAIEPACQIDRDLEPEFETVVIANMQKYRTHDLTSHLYDRRHCAVLRRRNLGKLLRGSGPPKLGCKAGCLSSD